MHALFDTVVTHHRTSEKAAVQPHSLRMKTYMFLLDLDQMDQTGPMVSINHFNIFAFYDRDHLKFLPASGEKTADRVRGVIRRAGYTEPEQILLLTNLRLLGYVFNPVSFYFCYSDQRLQVVLAEVNNTFGEQHAILIPCKPDNRGFMRFQARKNFYVSPFLKHDTELFFHFKDIRSEQLFFLIDSGYANNEKKEILLRTSLIGKRRAYTTRTILYEFFRVPLLTFRIIAAIHWHALRLYLKKIPFYSKDDSDAEIEQRATEKARSYQPKRIARRET